MSERPARPGREESEAPLITFAHRGARAHLPENTLAAFRYALEHGARGLETDARRSADGEIVLAHDKWLRARVGGVVPWRLRVRSTSTGRLGRHGAARLVDLYDELGSDYELSIDLKAPDIGREVIRLARERGAPRRLWLCDVDAEHLEELRGEAPDVKLVHSQRLTQLQHTVERHAADLAAARIDAMNMHHSEWSRGLVELFHRFDVRAFAWDVQEVRHLRSMLQIGVDAVYSDNVHRMVATVTEWATDDPPPRASGDRG
jgi:glycerophosphoryl diester phosphodiesterase